MLTSELSYPVISISIPSSKGGIDFHKNEMRFTICNTKTLDSGYYTDLILIDSAGRVFEVMQVQKLQEMTSFFQWMLNGFVKYLKIKLVLKECTEVMSVVRIKQLIKNYLENNPEFVDVMEENEADLTTIDKAMSIKDIFIAVCVWYDPEYVMKK